MLLEPLEAPRGVAADGMDSASRMEPPAVRRRGSKAAAIIDDKEVRVDTGMEGGRGPATAPAAEIIDGLNDLLQLNHDAIGAYDIAIEKLEDRDHATQISGFRLDHERHIRELNQLIQQLGATPKNEPHATGPLKEAMQSLGAMAGDRGALMAWRTNELQVRTKYDNYAARANQWPDEVKRMVDRQALDEERHYSWVAGVLGAGEGAETHLANKAREGAEALSHKARQGAGNAAETARLRTADGLDRAAERIDEFADRGAGTGAAGRAAGAAHRLADGMERAADRVRDGDVATLQRDIEDQVRTSPLKTLLLLFGVGFVLGRILR